MASIGSEKTQAARATQAGEGIDFSRLAQLAAEQKAKNREAAVKRFIRTADRRDRAVARGRHLFLVWDADKDE